MGWLLCRGLLQEIGIIMNQWGVVMNADYSQSLEVLGFEYRPMNEMIVDSFHSMW